ncbi:MAG TPA: hypothetical protein VKT82_01140 [Ktedonobacterales bacterium]|nr:hypothetical protein [Ktedonobacterales bacterium]
MTVRTTPLEQEAVPTRSLPLWKRYPLYGYLAIALNLTTWYLDWGRVDPFYRYSFFPLWFSFIIALDALNKARTGTSLMTNATAKFAQMFALSALFWWLFEAFNIPIQNWHYIYDHNYSDAERIFIQTLDFTTVLPVVMEMAAFWTSFKALRPRLPAYEIGPRVSAPVAARLMLLGGACVVLPFLFPDKAFPLIWLSVIFVLDPLNSLMGRKSALAHLRARDWRFFVALPLAGITCGFFWEMWNYFSLPKWYYTVPYVGFAKVFEMPILGYTGYLPFALELFALYQFLLVLLNQKRDALPF